MAISKRKLRRARERGAPAEEILELERALLLAEQEKQEKKAQRETNIIDAKEEARYQHAFDNMKQSMPSDIPHNIAKTWSHDQRQRLGKYASKIQDKTVIFAPILQPLLAAALWDAEGERIKDSAYPHVIESMLKRLSEKLEAGSNVWAASIAVAPGPEKFFRRLCEELDDNNDFADWISNPDSAAKDLWQSTKGDPHWDAGEKMWIENPLIKAWRTQVFEPVGAWKKAATYEPEPFTLSKKGYAVGSEIEVRQEGGTPDVNAQDGVREIGTPHTTNREAFADYLRKVKSYFTDAEALLVPNYYWNMHLNLSLSEKGREAVISHAEDINEIAQMLLMPANPYLRNIYKSMGGMQLRCELGIQKVGGEEPTNIINCKFTTPLRTYRDLQNVDIDTRCPARIDAGRLEMKCCSIWAGTDVDYLMQSLEMLDLLIEHHPERIHDFRENIEALYSTHHMLRQKDFCNKGKKGLVEESDINQAKEAEAYENACPAFREEVKKIFARYQEQTKSPTTQSWLSFINNAFSKSSPTRG